MLSAAGIEPYLFRNSASKAVELQMHATTPDRKSLIPHLHEVVKQASSVLC